MLDGLAPRKVEIEITGSLKGRHGRGSPRDKIGKRKKRKRKF